MSSLTESKKNEATSSGAWGWFGRKQLYEFEVVLFGFALVLGNRNFAWNYSLSYGIDELTTNTVFVGSAFICLCLCMGEMTSALPFSGGIFGFVRAATGPYYGFIVASFEVIFCLSYMVVMMYFLLLIPVVAGVMDASYTPQLIGIVYGFILFMNLLAGKPFWTLVGLSGFMIFLLLVIYICGTLSQVNSDTVDFKTFCATKIPVTFKAMMEERWIAISQYQGLQYLPLLSEYVKEPRKSVPRAMMICSSQCLLFSVFIALAACSTAPGQMMLQFMPTPLMFGFQKIFETKLVNGVWLHLPGFFAPTLTVLYCAGRQLYMIAKSGFLPAVLTTTTPVSHTPSITLTIAAIIGAGLNLAIYYREEKVWFQIINIYVLSSHVVFINAFIAYLFFRKKYSSMPRSFVNPFGIWAALYGLANYFIGFVSVILYAGGNSDYTLYLLAGYFVVATVFYWGYLVKRQIFSEEEKKLLFKAYLINANREKRHRMLRNNKVASLPNVAAKRNNNANVSTSDNNVGQSTSHLVTSNHEATDSPKDTANYHSLTHSSIRGPEEVEPQNHSQRDGGSLAGSILQYISGKFNAVAPLVETRLGSMTTDELQEYQQLAVLSAGGVIEAAEEVALEERLGLNDVEAAHEYMDDNNNGDNNNTNNIQV